MPTSGPKPRAFDSCWALDPQTGCHEWQARTDKKGYGRKKVAGRERRAHQLAWEQANGPIPNSLHVLHRCDNPGCVNVAHLFLGTNADNTQDKVAKGRQAKGEGLARLVRAGRVATSKINETDVERIRDIHRAGVSQVEIGAYFGIDQCHVSRILARKRRASVAEAA